MEHVPGSSAANNVEQTEQDRVPKTFRHPKGVFRFKTWEEFNAWKEKYPFMSQPPAEKRA